MSLITTPLSDIVLYLAEQYVADDGPGYVGQTLVRIAQSGQSSTSVAALAMQLSLSPAETAVDMLLCDIDRYSQAPDGHDLCCQGECGCAQSDTTYAHPLCEDCQDRPAEKVTAATQELLGLVDDRMLGYINYLLTGDKAAA